MLKNGIFFVCCLLLINSCSSKRPYTSEPNHRIAATQRPYTVLGKRYEPVSTHEGFVQSGIASWYGPDFHGRPTSSGERYDMHAMTAAHKTLPLGVYVKVINKENGREAIVRLNDRGPFVKGRIIDLSYAAARKLGVDAAGTAAVRIEALGYRAKGDGYKAPSTYDKGNYTGQVGAFKEYANAQKLSRDMKRVHGYSDVQRTRADGQYFYRVYAGRYSSVSAAETAEEKFEEQGYKGCFIVALD